MTAKSRSAKSRAKAKAGDALDATALPDPETLTTRAAAEQVVRAITRPCRGALPTAARAEVNAFLEAGKLVEARTHDAGSRAGCGQDINDIVCAGAFDGALHEYVCPRCGNPGEYRAPVFPNLKVR